MYRAPHVPKRADFRVTATWKNTSTVDFPLNKHWIPNNLTTVKTNHTRGVYFFVNNTFRKIPLLATQRFPSSPPRRTESRTKLDGQVWYSPGVYLSLRHHQITCPSNATFTDAAGFSRRNLTWLVQMWCFSFYRGSFHGCELYPITANRVCSCQR